MDPIHQRYQQWCERWGKKAGKVLKTDCYNETATQFPIAPLFDSAICLEVDGKRLSGSTSRFPSVKFVNGDIRSLPFSSRSFDLLIDLSTIDHVCEFELVLSEYRRVLKPKGSILLVAWITKGNDVENDNGEQFYFPEQRFEEEFRSLFSELDSELVPPFDRDQRVLKRYGLGVSGNRRIR